MYQGSYDPSLTLTGTYRDFGITEEFERRAGAEMPTNRELLQSLRDGFEQLALFDQLELNSLGERARMIIERVFGGINPTTNGSPLPPFIARLDRCRSSPLTAVAVVRTPLIGKRGRVLGFRGNSSPYPS